MTEYHIGCGITGIFAGTLNKKGDMWINKSDVTDEAIAAVAQYLIDNKKAMKFHYHDKPYILSIDLIESVEDDINGNDD